MGDVLSAEYRNALGECGPVATHSARKLICNVSEVIADY